MSEPDVDLLENAVTDQAAADSDDLPIVILPDDVDVAPVESNEPVEEPAPPPPAPQSSTAPEPEPEAHFSLEELGKLEEQIDDEIKLDQKGERRLFSMPWLCRVIALAAVALLALVLTIGREYYRLPLAARPLHYFHRLLRPSGTLGLSLGILEALVMLMSLSYLVRKSLLKLEWLGSIRSWMGFHILAGFLGPAIALLHAAFVPTSALGLLAATAMIIVVVSGIVGRYIAVYFPRSLEGRELKLEEVRGRLVVYGKKLAELGADPALFCIDAPKSPPRAPWLLPSLARVITGDHESRREYRRLKQIVKAKGELRMPANTVLLLIRKLCRERQWLVRYGELRRLVGAWRFLHRWFAVLLFVALLFHVLLSMKFGDLWILAGRK